jgi:hypothetical protein
MYPHQAAKNSGSGYLTQVYSFTSVYFLDGGLT